MAFESIVYIAKFIKTEINQDGVEVGLYENPKKFYLNHQPISGDMAYTEYGTDVQSIRRAYPLLQYVGGKIKKQDRVYLIDGDNFGTDLENVALNDNKYCDNANYEVISVLPSRLRCQIDLKKIVK